MAVLVVLGLVLGQDEVDDAQIACVSRLWQQLEYFPWLLALREEERQTRGRSRSARRLRLCLDSAAAINGRA